MLKSSHNIKILKLTLCSFLISIGLAQPASAENCLCYEKEYFQYAHEENTDFSPALGFKEREKYDLPDGSWTTSCYEEDICSDLNYNNTFSGKASTIGPKKNVEKPEEDEKYFLKRTVRERRTCAPDRYKKCSSYY